jgi:hypothetical protein
LKKKNPLLALRCMGFYGGLLPLNELKAAMQSKYRIFELSRTKKQCAAIASLQMLSNNPNAVSADHCQKGTQEFIYTLRFIPKHYLIKDNPKNKKDQISYKKNTVKKNKTKSPKKNISRKKIKVGLKNKK